MKKGDFVFSPNPTDKFIQISGLEKLENYFVYNLGDIIKAVIIDYQETIDVQNLVQRLYVLQTGNGNMYKFMKG